MKICKYSLVGAIVTATAILEGSKDAWFEIFEDTDLNPIASDVGFTEGPVWIDDRLFFSSLTTGKIYSFSDINGLDIYTENAGECEPGELEKRKLPGSNGMMYLSHSHDLLICQHCSRRIKSVNLHSGIEEFIVSGIEINDTFFKFNSPNDVAVYQDFVFFTDPPYGLKESGVASDIAEQKMDEASDLGFSGVFSFSLEDPDHVPSLVYKSKFGRPNGIQVFAFDVGDSLPDVLVFSECCGGLTCPRGEARWSVHEMAIFESGPVLLSHDEIVHKFEEPHNKGCADGFKMISNGQILASCPGGICLVSLDEKKITARLKTEKVISNLVIGNDKVYFTGDDHVWTLSLKTEKEIHFKDEL